MKHDARAYFIELNVSTQKFWPTVNISAKQVSKDIPLATQTPEKMLDKLFLKCETPFRNTKRIKFGRKKVAMLG